MNTPKKYTSVSRIGITAEFKTYDHCRGKVYTATFNFRSLRSFVDWVDQHNKHVCYVVIKDPKKTPSKVYTNWSRTFIAPFINRGCKCHITVMLDCGATGQLTFYKS